MPAFLAKWNHLRNFGKGHMRNIFLINYFEFGPVVQAEMLC